MLVKIKPHSTFQKYFNGINLQADLFCYADVLDYIRSMHPAFTKYIHNQSVNGLQETFTILDKNLREMTQDELFMRKPHAEDMLYIVPAIMGGGGKRGALALLAAAALIYFAPALLGISSTASTLFGLTTVGTLTSTIGLNLALMSVTMLVAPKTPKTEPSRDNNAFGSLVNTTSSGIPVALHYGLVRVAGQLITGYIKTNDKADGDEPTVDIIFSN